MKLKSWLQPIDKSSFATVEISGEGLNKFVGETTLIPNEYLEKNVDYVANVKHGVLLIYLK